MPTDEGTNGRTEGQTDVVKLIVTFRNFTKIPNNISITNLVWKPFNPLAPELFFLILAHPVYKM